MRPYVRLVNSDNLAEYEYHMSIFLYTNTLWLFNIAMENGPFIDGLPGFTY